MTRSPTNCLLCSLIPRVGRLSRWPWLFWFPAFVWMGWLASPWFMYYVVGVPQAEAGRRLEGTYLLSGGVSVDELGRVRPPDSFLRNEVETNKIHCYYVQYPASCEFRMRPGKQYAVYYHWFWGVLRIEYPPDEVRFQAEHDAQYRSALFDPWRRAPQRAGAGFLTLLALYLFALVVAYRDCRARGAITERDCIR